MKPETNSKSWYVLRTKYNLEKRVAQHLTKIGWEIFSPFVTTIRQWSDRKKKVTTPLIPAVIFVHCTQRELQYIYGEYGVLTVLKFENKPAVVRDVEISNLKILVHQVEGVEITFNEPKIAVGQPVKVVEGPFMGMIGESLFLNGKQRIKVKITALHAECIVNVPVSAVRVLEGQVA
jgi:transcription antitermination factor NusG